MINQALEQEIYNLVLGDDWTFDRTYKGAPTGTNIVKATMTIKEDEEEADVEAAAQVEVTSSASSSGQITNNGNAGTVALWIKVPHAKTTLMESQRYVYDVQLEHANGNKITVEKGNLYTISEVTRA